MKTGDIHLRKMWTDRKKQHAVLQPLKCKYCPWRFFYQTPRYLSHLRNHEMRWYKNPRLRCCPKVSPSKLLDEQPRTLCKHLEGTLFCSGGISTKKHQQVDAHVHNFCGMTFEINTYTKKHYELNHITCLICSKKLTTASEKTNSENLKHTLRLKCRFCGRDFNTFNSKIRHEKYSHVCEFCGIAFGNLQAKKFHKLKHHSMEWYNKCYMCGKNLVPRYSNAIAQSYACEICSKLINSVPEIKIWDEGTANEQSINAGMSANGQSIKQQSSIVGTSTIRPSINVQELKTKPLYPTDHDYAQFGSPYPPYIGIATKTPLNKVITKLSKGVPACR